MKRVTWPAWKVALWLGFVLIGLVFFWLGAHWWIIFAAAIVGFVALSY